MQTDSNYMRTLNQIIHELYVDFLLGVVTSGEFREVVKQCLTLSHPRVVLPRLLPLVLRLRIERQHLVFDITAQLTDSHLIQFHIPCMYTRLHPQNTSVPQFPDLIQTIV